MRKGIEENRDQHGDTADNNLNAVVEHRSPVVSFSNHGEIEDNIISRRDANQHECFEKWVHGNADETY